MTEVGPGDEALTWNVAGLLTDGIGADRVYEIANAAVDFGDEFQLSQPVAGRVRLLRTNRGILAHADLRTALRLECSRCLSEIDFPVDIRFQEEYLPALDLATGKPLATDEEPDIARLSDHHELDLETPVLEAILLAEPIAPLCRPDCPGLCIVCGLHLDECTHDHPSDDLDPRLEALRGFRPDGG